MVKHSTAVTKTRVRIPRLTGLFTSYKRQYSMALCGTKRTDGIINTIEMPHGIKDIRHHVTMWQTDYKEDGIAPWESDDEYAWGYARRMEHQWHEQCNEWGHKGNLSNTNMLMRSKECGGNVTVEHMREKCIKGVQWMSWVPMEVGDKLLDRGKSVGWAWLHIR